MIENAKDFVVGEKVYYSHIPLSNWGIHQEVVIEEYIVETVYWSEDNVDVVVIRSFGDNGLKRKRFIVGESGLREVYFNNKIDSIKYTVNDTIKSIYNYSYSFDVKVHLIKEVFNLIEKYEIVLDEKDNLKLNAIIDEQILETCDYMIEDLGKKINRYEKDKEYFENKLK